MRRGKSVALAGTLALAVLLGAISLHRCSAPSGEVAAAGGAGGAGSGQSTRTGAHSRGLASIRGTITDTLGAGIAHARVCANVEEEVLPLAATRDPRCVTATERGTYELVDLLPASYVVTSLADGHLPGRLEPFDLRAGEHRDNVDLRLHAGGVLVTGTVSDLGGGPVSHAQVHAFSTTDYESTATVETDDAGAFQLTVWPGKIGLSAVAESYTQQYAFGKAPDTFAIVLTPASTISGTVIDSRNHTPVAEATVELYAANDSRESTGNFDVTDDHGRFRFDRLNAGRYAAVARASHGYGRSDGSVRVGLGQHVDNLVVMLEPAPNVAGKIVVEGTPPKACEKPTLYLWRDGGLDFNGQADGAGNVHVEGVLPGSYKVNPRCEGYEIVGEASPLEVGDSDVTGLVWKFVPHLTGTVRGRVLDESGAAVAGALVSLGRSDLSSVTSQLDGSYLLLHVPDGAYQLHVDSPSGLTPDRGWDVVVTAGGTATKDLKLHVGGSIVVTVVDKTGTAIEGASVIIGELTLTTAKSGAVRLDNLPATTQQVMVDGSTSEPRVRDVQVRAGQVSAITVVADQRLGTISGVVIGADSQPRGDVFVVASLEYGGPTDTHSVYDDRFRVLARGDGTFSIVGLLPGSYGVRAYESGGGEAIVDHVKPGASVRIQIKPTGSIAGTVRIANDSPTDFTVRLVDARTNLVRSEHFYRTGGRYHFDDLPAGSYQITASDGALEGGTAAELTSGARLTGVDVAFDGSVTISGRVIDVATKLPVSEVAVSATLETGKHTQHGASGQDGRFTLDQLPSGVLDVQVSWWDADYSTIMIKRVCRGVVDLGDIAVAKRRNKQGEKLGRFGITFADDSLRVDAIDPSAPAAKTDLAVGDVVTSVDGIDLTGVPPETAWTLMSVPAGTAVRFGLARGVTIAMVAIPR